MDFKRGYSNSTARFFAFAVLAASVTGCTVSGSGYATAVSASTQAPSRVVINQPLPIAIGTARAQLGESNRIRCYIETDKVRLSDADAAVVEPGAFNVLWAKTSSSPAGFNSPSQRFALSENAPADFDLIYTVRLKGADRNDVRALYCEENFSSAANAVHPSLDDAKAAAGSAVTFE